MERAPLFEDVADAPEGGEAYWLAAADGLRVRGALWRGGDKGTVLIFPGRTEFIEKYGRAVGDLQQRGYAVAVLDWRGQGLGQRMIADPNTGHVQDFSDYQLDVAAFVGMLEEAGMPKPWFLLAHSMGACIGLRSLYEGLPVRAAAFTGPMWKISISPILRPVARLLSRASRPIGLGHVYAPGTEAKNYVFTTPFEGNTLTTDREMFDYMTRQMVEHPELAIGGPSMHWLSEALYETRANAPLPPPPVPALALIGSEESIVDSNAVRRIVETWPNATLEVLDGGQHEVLMETPEIRARCFDAMTDLFAAEA